MSPIVIPAGINLAVNPSGETNGLSGWFAQAGGGTTGAPSLVDWSSTWRWAGSHSVTTSLISSDGTTPPNRDSLYLITQTNPADEFKVVLPAGIGKMSFSLWSMADFVDKPGGFFRWIAFLKNASGTTLANGVGEFQPIQSLVPFHVVGENITVPADTAYVVFQLQINLNGTGTLPALTPGTRFWVDALQVNPGPTVDSYIDGDQGPAYSWTGTPHNSTSIRAEQIIEDVLPPAADSGVISYTPAYYLATRTGEKLEDITEMITAGSITMNQDSTPMWKLTGQIMPHDFLRRLVDHILVEITQTYSDGSEEVFPMGLYWITRVAPTYRSEGTSAEFIGEDLTLALVRNRAAGATTLNSSHGTYTARGALILRYYAGLTEAQVAIPEINTTIAHSYSYEPGTSYLTMANELLNSVALRNAYFIRQGILTSSLSSDLALQDPVAVYTADSSGNLIDPKTGTRRKNPIVGDVVEDPDDSRIKNRVTVRKITPGQPTISYTADNLNPNSPTYIGGPMGVMAADPVDDPQLASVDEAKARALDLLSMGSSYYRRVKLNVVPDLNFNPFDVVELDIRDENGDVLLDGKWWRRAVELPLGPPISAMARGMMMHLNRVEPVE